MQSPLAEMTHLYEDLSDTYTQSHLESQASKEERERSVKRVMNISVDPETGEKLVPAAVPHNAILSRIGHDVWVESFAFKPTSQELLAVMTIFLNEFTALIQRHQLQREYYLLQTREAFHFAFGSVTPPGIKEKYWHQKSFESYATVLKRLNLDSNKEGVFHRPSAWRQLVQYCQRFLDAVQPTMRFKEIKINPDGHVVLRMTIKEANAFLYFRNCWQRLFSENYVRYDDPEKITTLACVIGVVDLSSFNPMQQTAFSTELNDLFKTFNSVMYKRSYAFDVIEISESSNRMLQKQDMYGLLSIQKGYRRLCIYQPKASGLDPEQPNEEAIEENDEVVVSMGV
jgi:hypothetical protein